MKKLLLALVLFSGVAFAEPSFQQVEGLIGQHQYAAAEQGLEQIIRNHPNSAKAFYAMAQAQAGLGNLGKAQFALDKATGLDPDLKFASAANIQSLREAITPQSKKIEVVKEESHWFRNLLILIALMLAGYVIWRFIKSGNNEPDPGPNVGQRPPKFPVPSAPQTVTSTPSTSGQPAVVNNHYESSNNGLLTGLVLGNMLSNNHSHNTIIEREVVREAPHRDSSWDTPSVSPTPSFDTSWDDNSSSKSNSWDDSSSGSSSSDSSWDSGSSSSDSSWDSSNSSSSSDW